MCAAQLTGADAATVNSAKTCLDGLVGFALGTAPLLTVGVDVPKQRHGALIGAQAAVLKQIESSSGGCALIIPDKSSSSSVVQIEGSAVVCHSLTSVLCLCVWFA